MSDRESTGKCKFIIKQTFQTSGFNRLNTDKKSPAKPARPPTVVLGAGREDHGWGPQVSSKRRSPTTPPLSEIKPCPV